MSFHNSIFAVAERSSHFAERRSSAIVGRSGRFPAVPVPERAVWAVETLAVRPGDHLLEIGCGRGSAVSLVCAQLKRGHIVAIDRSATMVKIAQERNADNVAAGKASFQTVPLDSVSLDRRRFDKIFAINVNLFWVRSSTVEIGLIRKALKPGGAMYLFYEAPDSTRTLAIADRVSTVLSGHGFTSNTLSTTTKRSTAIVCLVARPG
jgi:cyclopropane fatty-acyl-phospholipid synthase-like methyltransferase